jgi:hypothetical protein
MPQLEPYSYRVISVPVNCTQYAVDQIKTMYVAEPPPQTITLGGGPPCAGTELVLIEDE